MSTFHLTIAKVGENLFDGEAVRAILPGSDGQFEVLANHEPLVSELKEGEVRIELSNGEHHNFPVETGIAEVSHNQATVLL